MRSNQRVYPKGDDGACMMCGPVGGEASQVRMLRGG